MSYCDNMSGSEDGQLRSAGEDVLMSGDEEDDTASLDIKPPQMTAVHSRDATGSRRKEKTFKDKKHSKERKHKDRNGRERDRNARGVGETGVAERERRNDIEHRDHKREERSELERYHQRTGYERDDVGKEIMANNEKQRYQKHYDRAVDAGGSRGSGSGNHNHNYHHHHHHQQYHQGQMHMQRQRQDYYERGQNYHHHSGAGNAEYHTSRHQQYSKHGSSGHSGHADYGYHDGGNIEVPRDRKRHSYEQQKDAESLEQDLRSRLLSKRHKYVRSSKDTDEQYEVERSENERNERSFEERETSAVRSTRHKLTREKEKEKDNVIEVLDSPEIHIETHQKRKHKRHTKERVSESAESKRKTPDDPELLARRAKILSAEREKEKRKESAREELQARRDMRRERTEVIDVLSPTAVAASVTAGLHVIKRKKNDEVGEHIRRKRSKKTKNESFDDEELGDDDSDDDTAEHEDREDSESLSDSAPDSDVSYKKRKSKSKRRSRNERNSDEEIQLPESPLSIGELSKSPVRKKKKKQKHRKTSDDDDDDEDANERSSRSRSRSKRSHSPYSSRSRSASNSASRSRSSQGGHSRSASLSHSATSRSRSRSRSYSDHSRSDSRSRSRSLSRSEERDMKLEEASKIEVAEKDDSIKSKPEQDDEKEEALSTPLDDKGAPLPNYFPGIQGCRSVEEFQCLNRIEEGTYGVVYRAKDKRTNEIVALKRLKMEKEKEGFPITSLREINTLLKGQHPNIVTVREIVVGSNMDKIFIVMDYVEHDLKSLMETMKTRKQSFFPGEVKCLTQQLLRAVGHLHDNWILHRDLKTSNLLLSHKGILKVGDFGLAREYGSPLKKYTSLVVTLWYRAPELLLCSPEYSTPIDIWSVGCIFAEFLHMAPLFPGKSEIDQLNRIFKELGTPNEKVWPGYRDLPAVKNLLSQNSQFAEYPVSMLRKHFLDRATDSGVSLMRGLLTYDPRQRLTAETALQHPYFKELPLPIDPCMFPTWPAKSELGARRTLASSPKPPSGGSQFKQLGRDDIAISGSSNNTNKIVSGIITGNKKSAANTGFVLNSTVEQRHVPMGPGFSLKF